MGSTPRALNRVFLGAAGVALLALGAGALALLFLPQARQAWETHLVPLEAEARQALASAAVDTASGQTSLFTLALLALMLLAVAALLWLMLKQRARRVSSLVTQQDLQGEGSTTLSHSFIKEAVSQAFESHPDLLAVTVTSLAVKKTPGVQVKLEVRQGASLVQLQELTARVAQGFDRLLGYQVPLLVRATGGLRATLHQDEQRVR